MCGRQREEEGEKRPYPTSEDIWIQIACYCRCGITTFLLQRHTKCYCCASTVPGNGLSVRYAFFLILKYDFVNVFFIKVDPVYTTICTWLLGYTCSDACGRLLLKVQYGNI
ncbi:hypothetical protein LXL04_023176 [Taraxacum kok-saghyz]